MQIKADLKNILLVTLLLAVNVYPTSKEEIRAKIIAALQRIPSTTTSGVLIFNPVEQDTIIAINHTTSMIPASNNKIFTTAAALYLLGGDFEVSTKILTDDTNYRDGVINGNLYLKGYGNPLFSSSDMDEMVNKLKRKPDQQGNNKL